MSIYHVQHNPQYEGDWWTRGGTQLWEEFATDPTDEDFCIPQSSFMRFLGKAQTITGWESPQGAPVVWREDP